MKKFTVDSEECTLESILKENVDLDNESTLEADEVLWLNTCEVGSECFMGIVEVKRIA